MKKIIILILFSISAAAFAETELVTVESILKNSRPAELPTIAGNYSALGSKYEIKKDYANALASYKKSLQIRKALGLDKTQGYAKVLFLASIVEHRLGNSCKAMADLKKVISIYNYLSLVDIAELAEIERLKEFKLACNSLLSQN
jgi:tetratricopeptide (TPR) repeat protein